MVRLKGFLYRKLLRKKPKEKGVKELVPGFRIGKPQRIVELPLPKDMRELNVVYPLIEPFAYANIKWDEKERGLIYKVIEPELDEREKEYLKKISEAVVETIEISLKAIKEPGKIIEYLEEKVHEAMKNLGIKLAGASYFKIIYYIYRDFVGLNEIEPLMQDPNIEDISCDGVGVPIYVIHRIYGSLKTSIVFRDMDYLREFIVKLAERCGRYVSYAEPILDATLPDGSRVAATIAPDVATKGPTFTIRKYGEKPFSPIEQIELKTANLEMMAYFWYIVEHRASILIIGGTATGKTSFLNSISTFIRPEAKIVSIEDTRELKLLHEHWIPTLARIGFGIPLPTGEKYGQVTLFDLLKESFRQNPDYVIVGETRGEETYVMFQGMSSGHASISTFHAGSLEAAVRRLISPPINLPPQLIESLNVAVTMVHAKEKGESARRIKEVYEIEGIDPATGEVKAELIFQWDPVSDSHRKVGESSLLRKIAEAIGATYEDVLKEIEIRKKVLGWLYKNGIKDFEEVSKWVMDFYRNRKKVLEKIGIRERTIKPEKIEEKKPKEVRIKVEKEEPEEKREIKDEKEKKKERRFRSILELLGFKEIREE